MNLPEIEVGNQTRMFVNVKMKTLFFKRVSFIFTPEDFKSFDDEFKENIK